MAIDAPPGGSERPGEEANILESRAANSASVAAIAQVWCVSLSASANGGASSRDAHLLAQGALSSRRRRRQSRLQLQGL